LIPAGQRYSPRLRQVLQANAIKDEDVISPKSINFYPDGTKIYVNALEGLATLVYSLPDLKKIAVIPHIFTAANANLFKNGETTVFDYQYYSRKNNLNVFSGKPVEGTFSKDGRYFFAPYYRRDFDHRASDPSAMAIIDTRIDQIVRVMPTGPLPKMVAVSPDGALLAVTHWGDNTIGLMDISSGDAAKFAYVKRLVVEPKLNTANIGGNRDKNCGHCLRGTVFTPDGLNLLVGRMSGGGVAVFSMPNGEYEGGFTDFSPSPRHLVVDSKGNLYSSDSREGTVNRVNLAAALDSLKDSPKRLVSGPKGDSLFVGSLPRTVALSPHEKSLYAVLHGQGELVRVDLDSFKVVERKKVCPRPVGLDVSRNGQFLGLTSQGGVDKAAKTPGFVGGNSFEIFKIQEPS
jgi:DNA-binding beta-propeller fold protein YncE